jgi:hypothetical protein
MLFRSVIPSEARNLLFIHLRCEVFPCGIDRSNKGDLFLATPFLNLRLSVEGISHVLESFKVDKPVTFVALREAFDQTFFVVAGALADVIRHADVNDTGATANDVDVEMPLSRHRFTSVENQRQRQNQNKKQVPRFARNDTSLTFQIKTKAGSSLRSE